MNFNVLNQCIRDFSDSLPPVFQDLKGECEEHFRSQLLRMLQKLALVTREEFDIQNAVLLKTRQQLETLERKLTALEQNCSDPNS